MSTHSDEGPRIHLSLYHCCLSALLAYAMLIGPIGFEQLTRADIQYNALSTTDWASGNRIITYTYDTNGSVESKTTRKASEPVGDVEDVIYEHNVQNRLGKVSKTTDWITSDVTEYLCNDNGSDV